MLESLMKAIVKLRRNAAPALEQEPRSPVLPGGIGFRGVYAEAHPRLTRVSYEKRRDGWYWRSAGPDPRHLRELGPFKSHSDLVQTMTPFEEEIIRNHEAKARAFGHEIVELRPAPPTVYDRLPMLMGLVPAGWLEQHKANYPSLKPEEGN